MAHLRILARHAEDLIVVKPSGMPTEMTADVRGESLIARIRAMPGGEAANLPHRLDRVSRGLVVVALTADALRFHNEQIRARAWSKHYLAHIPAPRDPQALLGPHKRYLKRVGRRATIVRAGGKPAFLEVLEIESVPGDATSAVALLRLDTGRYHQIRAMLSDLGTPLIGDERYGGLPGAFYLEHSVLRLPVFPGGGERVYFDANDPDRLRVGPRVAAALDRLGQGAVPGEPG